MRSYNFLPREPRIDFIGRRKLAYFFSAALVVASVFSFLALGLNFGIDFRGGILIEARTDGPADLASLRRVLGSLDLGEVQLQEFGEPDDVLIRVQRQVGDEAAQLRAIELVKEALSATVIDYRRTEFVGPKVGAELIRSATWAVILALGAILLYVWFRFEWHFGVGAIVALTHDVVTTIGLFAVTQLEFNLATVAAILTIAGYSINDTVVIYDRVRENLRKFKKRPVEDVLNLSLNGTLSRTLMTSLTTLLALLTLVILGGPIIRDFALAMIWGVLIGTYSSIYIASPVLLWIGARRPAAVSEGTPAHGGSE